MRSDAANQVIFLEESKLESVIIQGPPGCGKSTSTWFYALTYALNFPQREVWWVNTGTRQLFVLNENLIKEKKLHVNQQFDLAAVDILVLDGLARSSISDWAPSIAYFQDHTVKVIAISSQKISTSQLSFANRLFEAKAWTLNEYCEACNHGPFFEKVLANLGGIEGREYNVEDKRQLIEEKFTVAGHSARWMFDMTVPEVYTDISKYIRTVDNITWQTYSA